MLRVLFFILIVLSSFAVAQVDDQPRARKIEQFETATNGYVKMLMDSFYIELMNNPSVQGYILNYGTAKEIARREKQIQDSIRFRRFDPSKITLVRGGFRPVIKTEFWVVPSGAENPEIESTSIKIDEFGKANSGDIKARLDNYFVELQNNPDSQGFIIISGSTREITAREKLIKNYIAMRKFDESRIKFIRGGITRGIKTELWLETPESERPEN